MNSTTGWKMLGNFRKNYFIKDSRRLLLNFKKNSVKTDIKSVVPENSPFMKAIVSTKSWQEKCFPLKNIYYQSVTCSCSGNFRSISKKGVESRAILTTFTQRTTLPRQHFLKKFWRFLNSWNSGRLLLTLCKTMIDCTLR